MDRFEMGWLLDFYGPLLTEHRQRALRLYLVEDMSMGEIAGEMGITRQGVSDAIRQAQRQLEGYEQKLGLMRRFQRMRDEISACRAALSRLSPAAGGEGALREALSSLDRIETIERQ